MLTRRLIACAISAVVGIVAVPGVAQAATRSTQSHVQWCYTNTLTTAQMEAHQHNVIHCYSTESAMEHAAHSATTTQSFSYQRLARHYDTQDASGSSLSVYGTDCGGGGLSLAGTAWDNRIRSTVHGGCWTINHYTNSDYSGSVQQTTGTCGALRLMSSALDRQVSSIIYLGPEQGWCGLP